MREVHLLRQKLSYKVLSIMFAAILLSTVLLLASVSVGAANLTNRNPVATWTGAANDRKFSTPGNWAEGAVPAAGAILTFKSGSSPQNGLHVETLHVDVNTVFGGIVAGSNPDDETGYRLEGHLKFSGNPVIELGEFGEDSKISVATPHVTVQGNLTIQPQHFFYSQHLEAHGTVTVRDGGQINLPVHTSGLNIENGAFLTASIAGGAGTPLTVSYPVRLGGGMSTEPATLVATPLGSGIEVRLDLTNVTLRSNARVVDYSPGPSTVTVSARINAAGGNYRLLNDLSDPVKNLILNYVITPPSAPPRGVIPIPGPIPVSASVF